MKLGDYVMCWYTTYRMSRQQRNTQESCLNLIRNHILDSEIAEIPIEKVTSRDIQLFIKKLFKELQKNTTPAWFLVRGCYVC